MRVSPGGSVRVPFSVLGVVLLVLGLPGGWPQSATTARAQDTSLQALPGTDEVAVGVIVDTTNPRSMEMAREGGFTHAKMIIHWPRLEPRKGRFTFSETLENDLDNVMEAAAAADLKLVVRVDGAPDWAGGKPSKADPHAVEAFYAAMAAHAKGIIVAYEVLNEPNLPFEWGGAPIPSDYAAFLKAAYRGVKKGDPSALVIGGGLSPAAGGSAMDDLEFLRGMYAAGAKGSMDALAAHNYGGNFEPEQDPGSCGICFRRAELYRQIMIEQGDGATPIWATEFGWMLDPGRNMGQYDWMRVSADKQADYIVRSFKFAQKNWPWMTGLLLSNLDASTSPYHTGDQNGMPWFAILNKDHSPRLAWKAFKAWREQEQSQAASRPRAAAGQAAPVQPASGQPVPMQAASPAVPASDVAVVEATPVPTVPTQERVAAAPAEAPTPAPTAAATSMATSTTSATASAPSALAPSSAATRLRVTKTGGTGANLRARPAVDAQVLAILLDETTVDVVGEDVKAGGVTWKNVRTTGSTSDGVTGWVSSQYLTP
jgi:hypothetical protein